MALYRDAVIALIGLGRRTSVVGLCLCLTLSAVLLNIEILHQLYTPDQAATAFRRRMLFGHTQQTLPKNPYMRNYLLKPPTTKLDFFIAGFPKCGTTTLVFAFGAHNETEINSHEHCSIANPKIPDGVAYAKLDDALQELSQETHVKRGIKCPSGIRSYRTLERLENHSPETKLVIGVRHPVSYFQSYYNYRVTEIYDKKLEEMIPPIESLLGRNEWKGVSTDSARFELALLQLGKTDLTTRDLEKLQGRPHTAVKPNTFKIFLYSLEQMEDSNTNRTDNLRRELETFLELDQPLRPFGHENLNRFVGTEGHKETIDICENKYRRLRRRLVVHGRETQRWIRDEFLNSPDVTVANKNHFIQLLRYWESDPCREVNTKSLQNFQD